MINLENFKKDQKEQEPSRHPEDQTRLQVNGQYSPPASAAQDKQI